jgi:hypothetical protein
MFKLLVVFATIVAALGFRPTQNVKRSFMVMSDEMVGASVEVNGGKVYDPLDVFKLHTVAPSVFPHPKWMRESELKHCRIAMLASIGAFTAQYGLVIPGYTANPDPVANLNQFVLDWPFGFSQILISIALIEGVSSPNDFWFGKGDREAGNLGYDPLGFFKNKSEAQKNTLRLQELKNGRLAMIAMAAYTSEHWIPGSVPFLPGKF